MFTCLCLLHCCSLHVTSSVHMKHLSSDSCLFSFQRTIPFIRVCLAGVMGMSDPVHRSHDALVSWATWRWRSINETLKYQDGQDCETQQNNNRISLNQQCHLVQTSGFYCLRTICCRSLCLYLQKRPSEAEQTNRNRRNNPDILMSRFSLSSWIRLFFLSFSPGQSK